MNTEIQIFNNAEFGEIRTIWIRQAHQPQSDGQVWFVGKDVANVLGYTNPRKALLDHVDEDDKTDGVTIRDSIGRNQNPIIINESGLYALILSSKLPTAKKFKHWVTSVVLPEIRQKGGYLHVNADDNADTIMARAVLLAQDTIERQKLMLAQQESELKLMTPKAEFADSVTSSTASILIRDLAKLITQSCGIKIGGGRMFAWLRSMGYLFKDETRPYQKWVEQGLFDTTVTVIETNHGSIERCTTKVTGKGQRYFIDGFKSGRFSAVNGEFR